jgi:hypothetical protein
MSRQAILPSTLADYVLRLEASVPCGAASVMLHLHKGRLLR